MQLRKLLIATTALATSAGIAVSIPATAATKTTKKATKTTKKAATKKNTDPIKIAYLTIDSGPNALEGRHNPVRLAVQNFNARGGMDGHLIQLKIYDAGQTPDLSLTAVKKALSDNPNIVAGFGFSGQVQAVAPLVDAAGLPFIHMGQLPTLTFSTMKLPNMYRLNVPTDRQVKAMTKYIIETAKPKKVGLINTNDTNSHFGAGLIESQLKAAGIEVVAREVAGSSTDVTEAVLAFKDVNMVAFWGTSNVSSVLIKQRIQNGINVPQIDSAGGNQIASGAFGNSPAELKGFAYITSCDTDVIQSKEADAFRGEYVNVYGALDTNSQNPAIYDGLTYINAAVTKAGSVAPKDISAALASGISVEGACGTYKADPEHDLMQNMYVISTDGGAANKKVAATYKGL